jgi:hypothetical protein
MAKGKPDPPQISARIPPELWKALMTVAHVRKMSGREPYTTTGILIEALREWLAKHGGK